MLTQNQQRALKEKWGQGQSAVIRLSNDTESKGQKPLQLDMVLTLSLYCKRRARTRMLNIMEHGQLIFLSVLICTGYQQILIDREVWGRHSVNGHITEGDRHLRDPNPTPHFVCPLLVILMATILANSLPSHQNRKCCEKQCNACDWQP